MPGGDFPNASFLPVQDILGAPNMLGLIKTTSSGVPDPFARANPAFHSVSSDGQVEGDKATYFAGPGQRRVARITPYGGAPMNHQTKPIAEQSIKMIHSYEEMNLSPLAFQRLLQYDRLDVQRMGAAEVARHTTDFKKKFANGRIISLGSTLFNGKLLTDANGYVVPPGGSVGTGGNTLDWLIPDGSNNSPWGITVSGTQNSNRNVNANTGIDPLATGTPIMGNTAALTWANATNDIGQQFINLKQAAALQHGFPLKHCFYGSAIPSLLSSNVKTQNFMSRNVVVVNQGASGLDYIQSAEVPNGTYGMDWQPAYDLFFEDQNGVRQIMLQPNQIAICPTPTEDWLQVVEGSYTVPVDVWRKYPEMEAFNAFQLTYGMFSYSIPTMKPPTATMCYGDTYMYILKNPSVVYIITVA